MGRKGPNLCRVLSGLEAPWHEVVGDVLQVVQLPERVQDGLVMSEHLEVTFTDEHCSLTEFAAAALLVMVKGSFWRFVVDLLLVFFLSMLPFEPRDNNAEGPTPGLRRESSLCWLGQKHGHK